MWSAGSRFWRGIASGLTGEDAAIAVGASQAAGSRWFRQRGGMPTLTRAPVAGRHPSFPEREEIALLMVQGAGEGPQQAAAPGPQVGEGLEPGADLEPAQG